MEQTKTTLPEWLERQLSQGREFRAMVAPMEARADEEQKCVVEGYATTFDQFYTLYRWDDYEVQECVDRGAFNGCDMSDFILQVDHHGKVYARNRNRTLSASPDEHGLFCRAELAGVSGGPELYADVRGGYYDKMSFAFTVKRDKREVIEDREAGKITVKRTILEIAKLYDVSIVSVPANDATEVSARGLADGETGWAAQELRAFEARRKAKAKYLYKLKLMDMEGTK